MHITMPMVETSQLHKSAVKRSSDSHNIMKRAHERCTLHRLKREGVKTFEVAILCTSNGH